MSTSRSLTLFLAVLLLSAWVFAQQVQQSSTDQPGTAQPGNDSDQRMMLPRPLLGSTAPLAFQSELERSNVLTGGLAIGSSFDDNVLNVSSDRVRNFAYSVAPYIGISQSRSRLNWNLNYMTGFTMNQRYSALNQGSHDLQLDGLYRLAPHANFRIFDLFVMRTGFFDQASQPADFSSPGILDRPNLSVVTPLSRQTANTSTAELDYQFSASSMVGASGTFYLSHFQDTPSGYTLVDTESAGGQAFYNYRISARHMIGLTYRFQRFSFSPIPDGALVHSALLVYTFRLNPSLELSLFAGPEYVNAHTATLSGVPAAAMAGDANIVQRNWSGSGGATFNWTGQRNSVTAELIREVTDGGGLLGVVRANIADGGVRRQLTHSLGASLGLAYATNDSVSQFSTLESRLKTASVSTSFDRSLGNHIDLRFGYTRNYQQRFSVAALDNINHNRAWVSLQYNFARPLGR